MSEEVNDTKENKRYVKVLSNAVTYVANEPLILAQYEAVHEGEFARLWPYDNNDDQYSKRMNRAVEHLGGPPDFYFLREDQEAPPADNYPDAIMREAIAVFFRARKSIQRAHMFMAGASLLGEHPDLFEREAEANETLSRLAQDAFWEHAEAGYIRLHSFWDRIGQVLDFAFFNIRKFDQNGFTAVMDRIHSNAIPMDQRLKKSGCWKKLRTFQTSEKEDGLKWLLQRRNLIAHSLHLHPIETNDEGVFASQFNHLDTAHREKLRPRTPEEEVSILLEQLSLASSLFPSFLDLVEFSPSRKKDPWL